MIEYAARMQKPELPRRRAQVSALAAVNADTASIGHRKNSVMFDLISIVLTLAALIAWVIHRQKKRHNALLAKFREHNQRLGTSFPETSVDSELILSDKDKKFVIAFDPQTRKLCMVSGAKDPGEVLDFSYIRQWQLKWTEVSGNGGLAFKNVHFAFSTNDLKRPLIHVPVAGKGYGDTWNSRLGILMGA